ncbi:MAG: hypothetical protein JWN98_2660 [Abditibacteriota bacterium]|nr:hypothetical protein [Abditibacteriota bacterium]
MTRTNLKDFSMYLLSYFRTPAEALHFALSEDGFTWRALNQNRPVLSGQIGSQSLRDPFVFQARDGVYHMLATDGWKSDSIVHAQSYDLIAWSSQRLLPVMQGVPMVRNCWAPECFYDIEDDCYRLIWSSATEAPNNEVDWNHRIWSCSTRDFKEFSAPEKWFDPGYSVIDATVLRVGDEYLMAFKDERGLNQEGSDFKAIRIARSKRGSGPWQEISDLMTPTLTEGPSLFFGPDGSTLMMIYDHFIDDRFGMHTSRDGHHWQIADEELAFPPIVRHASVLPIDEETAARLQAHWEA